jgi:hypothetical protein
MKETQKKNAGKKVSEVVANCNFKSCQCEGHGGGLCAITKMQTTPETVLGLLGNTLDKYSENEI